MHNLTTSTKEYKDILKDLTDKEYGQATSIKILTSIFGLLFIIWIILSFSIWIWYLSDLAMRWIISDGLVISAPILFTLAWFSFLAFVSYYTNMPWTGWWDMSMYDNYTALDSLIREDSYSIGDALEKVEKTYIFVRRIISLRNRSYLFNNKTQKISGFIVNLLIYFIEVVGGHSLQNSAIVSSISEPSGFYFFWS